MYKEIPDITRAVLQPSIESIELVKIARFLQERSRSWIMLLIRNDNINNLYIHNFSLIQQLLLPCYQQAVMSYYAMQMAALSSEELDIFCVELAKCALLEKLDLTKNDLGKLSDDAFRKLITAIKQCKSLKSLYLGDNYFTPKQMLYIVENLDVYNIEFGKITSEELVIFSNRSSNSNPNHAISSLENNYNFRVTNEFGKPINHNAIANFLI